MKDKYPKYFISKFWCCQFLVIRKEGDKGFFYYPYAAKKWIKSKKWNLESIMCCKNEMSFRELSEEEVCFFC